jgi:hypothetical protein
MDIEPPPPEPRPDPAIQLQRDIYLQIAMYFRSSLPAPSMDTPEAFAHRERVAIGEVAAMLPVNAYEASLAARAVAAGYQVDAALCELAQCGVDSKVAGQLRAQAASMGREARGFGGLLMRVQAERHKREARDLTREVDARTEYSTHGLLTLSQDGLPPRAPRAAPSVAEPPPPPLTPEEAAEAERQEVLKRRASRYAILHTVQVKRIRKHGGLPPDCDFEPPDPELLHAIVTGDGSNLRWAETYEPWVPPEVAPEG